MTLKVYPQLRIFHNLWARPAQGGETYQESQANCASAGGAGLLNSALGHAPGDAGFVTHHQFRLLAGNPGQMVNGVWVPTGLASTAVLSVLKSKGVKATRYAGESIWTAWSALQAGAWVAFLVQYSAINAYASAIFSGDRTFMGGHTLVCGGPTRHDPQTNLNYVQDWDALLDQRRASIKLAPVEVPFQMIRRAAGAFLLGGVPVGKDKGIFTIVEP